MVSHERDCFLAWLPLLSPLKCPSHMEVRAQSACFVPGISPCWVQTIKGSNLAFLCPHFPPAARPEHGAMSCNCSCKSFPFAGPICCFPSLLQSPFCQCQGLLISSTLGYHLVLQIIDRQGLEQEPCHRIVIFFIPFYSASLNCHFSVNS